MSKQAPHVAALKQAFHEKFNLRANVRNAAGNLRPCLFFTVPAFASQEHPDRPLLVAIGAWLEANGFYQCHDYHCQGLLSLPSGWTCWKGGAEVLVQYHQSLVQGAGKLTVP